MPGAPRKTRVTTRHAGFYQCFRLAQGLIEGHPPAGDQPVGLGRHADDGNELVIFRFRHALGACGNLGESYWRHMATMLRVWQQELRRPKMSPLNLTKGERVSIEARVRKELYP